MRAVLFCVAVIAAIPMALKASPTRILTFEERVEAQRAIEDVFWRHRIWPSENPGPKPTLSAVMTEAALRSKVSMNLRISRAFSAPQLQGEIDRMARSTKAPAMLRELFLALGDDPFLVAETLARQSLAERIPDAGVSDSVPVTPEELESAQAAASYTLPRAPDAACTPDSWTPTAVANSPSGSGRAVWTGSEMLVWGTVDPLGARYNPTTDSWTALSSVNAPAPRRGHAALWTGSKLLVWGGTVGVVPVDVQTGGLYDPATDTWVATSLASAAAARSAFTAVWTGSVMVVWGGIVALAPTSSGARYDPATDSWSPTSLTGAPAARYRHTAVWAGSSMIVWGGRDSADLNTGGRYDPVLDQWLATSTFPVPPQGRTDHTAVWTGTRMIVWGGHTMSPTGAYLASGGTYDPVSNVWSGLASGGTSPGARSLHSAVWTGTKMIVWGGGWNSNPNNDSPSLAFSSGSVYDPATGWTPTSAGANCAAPRWSHNAVWTGSEMLVQGGTGGTSGNALGRYNPVTDTWALTQDQTLPIQRSGHVAVWTGSEMIIWGGGTPGNSYSSTGGRYVPATDSWQPTAATSVLGRNSFTGVWTGTRMVVWGGLWSNSQSNAPGPQNTGGRYDPATNSWADTSLSFPCPTARFDHTAVWTGTRMIVWGGHGIGQNDGGSYDPVSDAWTAIPNNVPNVPAIRTGHGAVWTGRDMIIWGGTLSSGGVTASGARYDPASGTWLPVSSTNAPSARSSPSAVWTGREMVVWGGSQNTGGRYNPITDTWVATSLAGAPSSSSGNTVVWTGKQMIVWGGGTTTGGRYDPANDSWLPTETVNAPTARSGHTAVMTSSEMIVWGGSSFKSGGRYCVEPCDAPTSWHQDADADGYGSPTVTRAACTQPYAHVADASDCNDWTAAAYPGHAEVCGDGIDNDCNAVVDDPTIPSASLALSVSRTPTESVVSWSAVPFAIAYDVQRGALLTLRSSGGDYTTATSACLADGTNATSVSDADTPAVGEGSWYLARGTSCGGAGGYDEPVASQIGSRNAEIAASGAACP